MVDKTAQCGTQKLRYPADCTYVCVCPASGKCVWTVTCPGGGVFTGEGLVAPSNPKPPHVTLAGSIGAIAKALQKAWKRPVVVPTKLRRRRIRTRTLRGTPEQIADALGLQLGARRGG